MAQDANNHLVADQVQQFVYLWDLGPTQPKMPERPKAPAGKEGDPDFELKKLEFQEVLEAYQAALKTFRREKAEFEDWQQRNGGPIELRMFSVDAWDALQRDKRRYCISARTRGHERRPNQGLPEGLKPGHGHAAQLERERAGEADLEAARRRDPVFGQQEMRA